MMGMSIACMYHEQAGPYPQGDYRLAAIFRDLKPYR